MTTSYPAPVFGVNDFSLCAASSELAVTELSPSALSFYRWLCRWHAQTGEVYASTRYLARKQRRTERTVYRWLAELRDAGCIAVEVAQGVQRSIVPLIPAPRCAPFFPSLSAPYHYGTQERFVGICATQEATGRGRNVRGRVRGFVRGRVRGPS